MKAHQVPPLKDAQRQELEAFYHQTRDARLRMSVPQIAEVVRESPSTVLRCLKRYGTTGVEGLMDRPRRGRPRKGSPAYVEKLLEVVGQRPRSLGIDASLWTLDLLVEYLAEQLGERVSGYTLWRRLGEAGIVFSRPQHTITSPDPDYLLKKGRLKKRENT
jgi:transposase